MKSTNEPPVEPKLRGVVWRHFVTFLDEHGLRAAARFVLLTIAASFFSWLALFPEEAHAAVTTAVTWRNYAMPTVAWIFALTFAAPYAWRFMHDSLERLPAAPAGDTIEGMDTERVIAHLTQHRTFRRDDVERIFGVPRYRYTALVQRLKKLGVLVAGDNNMSVLSAEWSPDRLRDLLVGRETAAELELPVRIVRPEASPPLFRRRTIESESPTETAGKPAGSPCATLCAA